MPVFGCVYFTACGALLSTIGGHGAETWLDKRRGVHRGRWGGVMDEGGLYEPIWGASCGQSVGGGLGVLALAEGNAQLCKYSCGGKATLIAPPRTKAGCAKAVGAGWGEGGLGEHIW